MCRCSGFTLQRDGVDSVVQFRSLYRHILVWLLRAYHGVVHWVLYNDGAICWRLLFLTLLCINGHCVTDFLSVCLPQSDLRVIETTQPVCFLQLSSPPVRYCFSSTCTCNTVVVASSRCLLLHWATSQLPAAITAWGACHSAGNNLSKSMDCFLKRQSDFKQRAVWSSLSRLHWRVWIQGQTF